MKIKEIIDAIERYAPLSLQESWDNAGVQVGNTSLEATGALLCTDVTEAIVGEAVDRGYNLVISHHPLIFHALKKITGRSPVERIVEQAIKRDLTIYCAHTNMDNVPGGVNFKMAEKLGMTDVEILAPREDNGMSGLGVVGHVEPEGAVAFLKRVKDTFGARALRYSGNLNRTVGRVALCGGAGASLIEAALHARADVYVTGDVKYHEFAAHENSLILADIGHYESEQYTKEIFLDVIQKKNPTFAVAFASKEENQVKYL